MKLNLKGIAQSSVKKEKPKTNRLAEQKFFSEVVEAIEARRKLLDPKVYKRPKA